MGCLSEKGECIRLGEQEGLVLNRQFRDELLHTRLRNVLIDCSPRIHSAVFTALYGLYLAPREMSISRTFTV